MTTKTRYKVLYNLSQMDLERKVNEAIEKIEADKYTIKNISTEQQEIPNFSNGVVKGKMYKYLVTITYYKL